jgi:hypothetical protein
MGDVVWDFGIALVFNGGANNANPLPFIVFHFLKAITNALQLLVAIGDKTCRIKDAVF